MKRPKPRRHSPELAVCLRDIESVRAGFDVLRVSYVAMLLNRKDLTSKLSKRALARLKREDKKTHDENLLLIRELYREAVRILDLNRAAWLPPERTRETSGEDWLKRQLEQFGRE